MINADKLVIARLPRTLWLIFSLFFEISRENMKNLENIGNIIRGTV